MNTPNRAGCEDFDQDDFVIARRAMMQNTSKKIDGLQTHPGMFVDRQEKRAFGDSMHVVLVSIKKSRALFWDQKLAEERDKKGTKCYSRDGKTPDPRIEFPQATSCASCDYNFKDLQYDMLFLDVAESLAASAPVVFSYRARGTSNAPVRRYVSSIIGMGKVPMEYTCHLASTQAEGQRGNYYTLAFNDVEPIEPNSELATIVEDAYARFSSGQAATETDDLDGEPTPF